MATRNIRVGIRVRKDGGQGKKKAPFFPRTPEGPLVSLAGGGHGMPHWAYSSSVPHSVRLQTQCSVAKSGSAQCRATGLATPLAH